MLTEINNKLNSDCKILVDGILEALDDLPEAILLCGGYGRGEGSWFEDEQGNPNPYNDYDLAVITDKPLSRDKYRVLRKELAIKIGINWVDIDCYTHAQLNRMYPTIHNVDLFYASKVLWGNEEWRTKYKQLDSDSIGKEDITKLYVTRMWTLLGSLTSEERDLNVEEARFFKNQMAKGVLAGCDMRLVANHRYTTSYRERVKIICNELLNDSADKSLCEWAIREKLNPSSQRMLMNEVKALYDKVYAFFVSSFDCAMGKESMGYLNPDRTNIYVMLHTLYLPMIIYGFIRGNRKIIKCHNVMRAQNYVFRAYSPSGEYNRLYLAKANSILMHYNYIDAPVKDWRKLCLIVANARNNV